MLRTFSGNPTCRHIIFGGCHDAGYLLNLEQFKHNELTAARITLLETTPAFRGFADLSHFKRARFEKVFKSEPLPESTPSVYVANPSAIVPSASAPPLTQSPGPFRTTRNQSPRQSVSSPSPNTPPSSVSGQEYNGDASWGMYGHHVSFCLPW
jgi:hypothetical protein